MGGKRGGWGRTPPSGGPRGKRRETSRPKTKMSGNFANNMPLAGINLFQIFDTFFSDIVANHAIALTREFLHIYPGSVEGPSALGNDPSFEQRLDQGAKDVSRFRHETTAILIGERFHHRSLDPFPIKSELGVN